MDEVFGREMEEVEEDSRIGRITQFKSNKCSNRNNHMEEAVFEEEHCVEEGVEEEEVVREWSEMVLAHPISSSNDSLSSTKDRDTAGQLLRPSDISSFGQRPGTRRETFSREHHSFLLSS